MTKTTVLAEAPLVTVAARRGSTVTVADAFRIYRETDVETVALRGVDLKVASGEYIALMGRSGSGKSTLIGLIAGADRPSAGRVIVDDVDLATADDATRARFRGATIGIVFQAANLVDFLDLAENVQLTCALAGRPIDRATAVASLGDVGLAAAVGRRASRLSGGEQQRAALAMILASRPALVLADEITGELDSATAASVLDLLDRIRTETGATVIVATHDPAVAARADRTVELRDGTVRA